ncbi:hypothetical protein ACMBCM_08205, partial [Spiroplasma sp. K1]
TYCKFCDICCWKQIIMLKLNHKLNSIRLLLLLLLLLLLFWFELVDLQKENKLLQCKEQHAL